MDIQTNQQNQIIVAPTLDELAAHLTDLRNNIDTALQTAYEGMESGDSDTAINALNDVQQIAARLHDIAQYNAAALKTANSIATSAMMQRDELAEEIDALYDEQDDRIQEVADGLFQAWMETALNHEGTWDRATLDMLVDGMVETSVEEVSEEYIAKVRRLLKRAAELAQRKAEYGDESKPYNGGNDD